MKDYTTLQEITGHESGILVFQESNEVIVCNWMAEAPDGGIPRVMFGAGLIAIPEEIKVSSSYATKDVRHELPGTVSFDPDENTYEVHGMEILYDDSDDIPELLNDKSEPISGTCYVINDDVLAIAPDDWA